MTRACLIPAPGSTSVLGSRNRTREQGAAQCPKCNESIGRWKWFGRALAATSRSQKVPFNCPNCGADFVLKSEAKPGIVIFFSVVLVAFIFYTIFQGLFHPGMQSEGWRFWLFYFFIYGVYAGYLLAKAFGAKLEEPPPDKKFFNPDHFE